MKCLAKVKSQKMVGTKKFLLVIFILSITQVVMAQHSLSIQSFFNRWAQKNGIIGAALAVNDQNYVYGFSDQSLTIWWTRCLDHRSIKLRCNPEVVFNLKIKPVVVLSLQER